MTDFLSKLFSNPKKENNHLGEASLMQGARFNKMQRAIERPVYSHLPLMEQTTGSGLGSIKEPLENNSQLPKLDDKELKELSKMENEYERLITQLKNIQSVNLKTVIGMKKMSDLESQIKNNDIKCTAKDKDEYYINQKADYIVNTICLPLVALYLVQKNISDDKVKSTDDMMSSSFLKTSDK